jgi:hypothetical protein
VVARPPTTYLATVRLVRTVTWWVSVLTVYKFGTERKDRQMGRKLLAAFWETRTVWILGPILVGMTYVRFVWPF